MKKKIKRLSILWAAVLLLCSCTTMNSVSKKFTAQDKANIGVFADQTIAMLKDAEFGFSRKETLYLREFFDALGQEEQAVRSLRQEADAFFVRMVKYSLDLVLIAETAKTPEERVAAYSDRVNNMDQELFKKLDMEPDRYKDIKDQVAESKEFVDALRLGQPIINASGRYLHHILENLDKAIDDLAEKIDVEIDVEFAEVINYQEKLETEKYNILRSLAYLYGAYKGNMEAYALLDKTESIHRKDLIPDPPPSEEDLEKIAEYLQRRLTALHVVENEIRPDWDNYRAAHLELDVLYDKAKRENTRARMIMLVWLRAHQKMASGVTNPAEWYDIKSLPAELIKMGAGGAGLAL